LDRRELNILSKSSNGLFNVIISVSYSRIKNHSFIKIEKGNMTGRIKIKM